MRVQPAIVVTLALCGPWLLGCTDNDDAPLGDAAADGNGGAGGGGAGGGGAGGGGAGGGGAGGGGAGGGGAGGGGAGGGGAGGDGGAGGGGASCGPMAECPPNAYCDFSSDGFCTAETGTCVEIPADCPDLYDPVCGCDGKTYPSDCDRKAAGQGRQHTGPCGELTCPATCESGTSCQCCPAGGPTMSCTCSTECSSDTDCKDAARPLCNKPEPPFEGKGFCTAVGFRCCWGCR